MSGLPHSANPVAIAKETVALAKESGSPGFEKAAKWALIASAAVTAAVGLLHAIKTITRDLIGKPDNREHGRSHARPESKASDIAQEETHPPSRASEQERSWVSKARTADREPHARHARLAHHDGHGVGGRH